MEFEILHLSEVGSTNDYLHELNQEKYFAQGKSIVVQADYQTSGHGAGQNIWQSNNGMNLLTSIAIATNIKPKEQFIISKVVSLALLELLKNYGIDALIKWPNDIIVERHKIAGILIENSVMADQIKSSVIGIGLNVNQIDLEADLKATSMTLLTKNKYEIQDILEILLQKIGFWFEKMSQKEMIDRLYFNNLFGNKDYLEYKYKGDYFDAIVSEIDEFGRLVLKDRNGAKFVFNFKEVEMIY